MRIQLMPRVKPELLASKLAGSSSQDDQNKVYLQIAEENPVLWGLLETVMENEEWSQDKKDGYYKAAHQFYSLLATQMEINQMEEEEVLDDTYQ